MSAISLSIIAVQQAMDWTILLTEEQESYKNFLLSMGFFHVAVTQLLGVLLSHTLNLEMAKKPGDGQKTYQKNRK